MTLHHYKKLIQLNQLKQKDSRNGMVSLTSHITSNQNTKIDGFFFLPEFSFTDTDNSQDSKGREEIIFYSTLPLPPAHEHSDIYFQLCMWDDFDIFLIATLVFTRLLFDEITTLSNYHLIDWECDVNFFCLFTWWFDSSFFVTAVWDGKRVDTNSYRLSSVYYKQTD